MLPEYIVIGYVHRSLPNSGVPNNWFASSDIVSRQPLHGRGGRLLLFTLQCVIVLVPSSPLDTRKLFIYLQHSKPVLNKTKSGTVERFAWVEAEQEVCA